MVRAMKTGQTILELASQLPVRRMAHNLVAQLIAVMPELAEVRAWHSVGQQRSLDELGHAAEQTIWLGSF
jgi:hypothetical protein